MGAKGTRRLIEFFSTDASLADAFECLFENASDAIYILDKHGKFVAVNRKAEELTGFKREEWIGKSFRKVISARSLPKAIRGFLNVISGKPIRLELELKTAFQKKVLVEVTSKPFFINGKTVGTLGIVRDITERKKAEEALIRLSSAVKMTTDSIVISDLDTKIIGVNEATLKMYGTDDKKDLIGKSSYDLIAPEDREKARAGAKLTLKKGYVKGREYNIITKDGSKIPVEMNVAIMKDSDGKPIGFVGISRDITERRLMQKKLQEYSEHLEELVEKRTRQLKDAQEQLLKSERLAAIGEMAAMVGHDLRNPLTGIAGAAYYLRKKLGSKMDRTAKEMLAIIEKDVEYSNKIIGDLLEYSREIQLELVETTPKSITKHALTSVKVPKNIRILNLADDKPKIKIDVQKMKRVLINIIKNAVEAMPKGDKLTIKSKKTNSKLKITFTDTGIGIPKDILEKIWTPLFTTKAKGIGLGLPICKRIVEAHEGTFQSKAHPEKEQHSR